MPHMYQRLILTKSETWHYTTLYKLNWSVKAGLRWYEPIPRRGCQGSTTFINISDAVAWRRESGRVVSYPAGLSVPSEGPRMGPAQWTPSRTLLQAVLLISRAANKALSRSSLVGDTMEKSCYLAQIFPTSLDSLLTHPLFPASWSILQTKQNSARHLRRSLQTGFAATCYNTSNHNDPYSRTLMESLFGVQHQCQVSDYCYI